MNEEIEYAEMLEIPVSTVNVIRRTNKKHKTAKADSQEMKEEVISKINDSPILTENSFAPFEPDPEREQADFDPTDFPFEESGIPKGRRWSDLLLKVEFGLSCALCLGIFLTNVWMPESAVNTFFRSLTKTAEQTDERDYSDFVLSGLLSEDSDAEMTISPTGILSFVTEGCVYPAADGKISQITQNDNGTYTVKISHTDSFTGIIDGLDYISYEVGQNVKNNVPIGYTNGNAEVKVTMYSDGQLLNCFSLDEDNTLAWVTEED
jgi:hypothetical protein